MKQSMNMGGSIASKNILERMVELSGVLEKRALTPLITDGDFYLKWIQTTIYKMHCLIYRDFFTGEAERQVLLVEDIAREKLEEPVKVYNVQAEDGLFFALTKYSC